MAAEGSYNKGGKFLVRRVATLGEDAVHAIADELERILGLHRLLASQLLEAPVLLVIDRSRVNLILDPRGNLGLLYKPVSIP
jgi:hypothetical protein